MIRRAMWVVAASFLAAATLTAQAKLSTQWEELTAGDFRQGIQRAASSPGNRFVECALRFSASRFTGICSGLSGILLWADF